MNYKICMVVVTYNRRELLLRNINAVLNQSYPLDILIFDNHSSDGTNKYLDDNKILGLSNIHYYYSDTNLGGAGGFCNGMKKAYEMGYDFIWLMDDDGFCWNRDTLFNLVKCIPSKKAFILNSTVICDKNKTLTFGFLDIDTYDKLCDSAKNNVYEGYINPFNGTLISKECIQKIGFPKGEFFIYGDEHEYMLRAKKNKVYIGTVINSFYYHPINRRIKTKKVGKYEIPIKEEPVWKTYCDTRNSIYIMRHYYGIKMQLIKIYVVIVAALLKKKNRFRYLKYTIMAVFDAYREKFDRPLMFDK